MAFKDILLALTTYPEATPVSAVDGAVDFAAAIGARISAVACQVKVRAPGSLFANSLVDVSALVAAEGKRSLESAEALLAAFQGAAEKRGVFEERILEHCPAPEVREVLVGHARLRDLTIVAVPEGGLLDQWNAESIIFGSGRPTVVMSVAAKRGLAADTVVVAWDFSRPAARAVADALPILEKAKSVRVVTVTNEKVIDTRRSGAEFLKHLARHGVKAALDSIEASGRGIGEVLESYVTSTKADLLVMGAYGHSRIRDFILGGATKSMISRPPLPIFLAH